MRIIKRSYDEGYHDTILYKEAADSQRNEARLALLLESCPGGKLLEAGFGQGGFLHKAAAHYDVTGIDISIHAVNSLRPHFGERVRLLNLEQKPLNMSGLQAIAAFNILEHMRQPHKVVDKFFAALDPGGVLVGSVPNNSGFAGLLATPVSNFFDRTHISTFTPPTWSRIFTHAGFQQVDFFGELTVGRNRCVYIRRPQWHHISFNLMFVCKK